MKKQRNIIHIKLDTNEALRSKRDVLETEADLIKIAQAIRNYKELRLKELEYKILLQAKVKELHSNLRKTKSILPKPQIPKILKKHEDEIHSQEVISKAPSHKKETKNKKGKKVVKKKPVVPKDDLESQLQEIQSKLNKLG